MSNMVALWKMVAMSHLWFWSEMVYFWTCRMDIWIWWNAVDVFQYCGDFQHSCLSVFITDPFHNKLESEPLHCSMGLFKTSSHCIRVSPTRFRPSSCYQLEVVRFLELLYLLFIYIHSFHDIPLSHCHVQYVVSVHIRLRCVWLYSFRRLQRPFICICPVCVPYWSVIRNYHVYMSALVYL